MMTFLEALERSPFLLADGGIETRIAFETDIALDDEVGGAALEAIYREYLAVGRRHDLPMQVGTPTFRASPERLRRAGRGGPGDLRRVNGECAKLLRGLRDECGGYGGKVFIAGVI